MKLWIKRRTANHKTFPLFFFVLDRAQGRETVRKNSQNSFWITGQSNDRCFSPSQSSIPTERRRTVDRALGLKSEENSSNGISRLRLFPILDRKWWRRMIILREKNPAAG
ncbi:hypothetical protein KSP39_PZI007382 [Platanthera zijinensis]|uniref:Uncharacterized protein n=1 Tax=Platanthera zijinensis TaxID=2320716 RepID=A0AAP0BRN9_9ASPA